MAGQSDLEQAFKQFAKFGNSKSEGKEITLTNSDKWLKEAKIIDNKKISTTDTAIIFQKLKSKTLTFQQYMQFLESLAKDCKLNLDEVKAKLAKCNTPGTSKATTAEQSDVVDRLTDTSKYTGSHKERFDQSGKGKGIEGRMDVENNDGYVSGYKNKDTYDKKK